jgi:hypothetical protein
MDWKKIDDFDNYSISSEGQVRNDKFDRILKQTLNHKGYYRVGLCENGKQKQYSVHRLVAIAFVPLEDGCDFVDHHDGEPTNNSVENLRWCNLKENSQNRSMSKNNKSGFKGVHFENGKWRAYINIDGKKQHLGCFDTIEEAAAVRAARANQVFGVFTNACESV